MAGGLRRTRASGGIRALVETLRRRVRRWRAVGPWGERVAARHLRRRGLTVIARNFRVPSGEIDIVAIEGRTLVLVEVKTVLRDGRSHGIDRIGPRKQARIRRAAHVAIRRCRRPFDRWRADAVIVEYAVDPGTGRRRAVDVAWYPALFEID